VLPLHVIGEDSREAAFADGLSEELTTRLARVNGLRLISSTSALRARKEGFDAQQLAERLQVTHAIEGSLREAGDQLRIDLRLIETPSGRTLWAQSYDRKFADIFALQDEMARAVVSALALHIDLAPANAPAGDPQVFRDYLELRHIFFSQSDEATVTKAETELNSLAARAKDFAPVHGLLALNLAAGYEGDDRQADALHEARQALDIDPNDVHAHAALGVLASYSHDWTTVKKEYDTALALSPNDGIIRSIVGMWLGTLGYREQALSEFEKLYQSDPLSYWVVYNRATILDTLGRHDEAKLYLDMLPELDPQSPWTVWAQWRNAVWRHDYVAAHWFVERMSDQSVDAKAYAAVTEAMLEPTLWPQADQAIDLMDENDKQASTLRLFRHPLNATAALKIFENGNQQPNGKMLWTADFASLHQDPEFQNFLHRMKFIDFWRSNGWPPQCKPEGEGARCK
jgi:TolB-like protein/Tfp pilus assembly protein PilF